MEKTLLEIDSPEQAEQVVVSGYPVPEPRYTHHRGQSSSVQTPKLLIAAAMPISPSDRRRRARGPKTTKRQRSGDEEEDEEEKEVAAVEADEDEDLHPNPKNVQPSRNDSEVEVISGSGVRISEFPIAVMYEVNRPHSSVLEIAAANKGQGQGQGQGQGGQCAVLENISYGQLQALSAVPSDSPSLMGSGLGSGSGDYEPSVVITPPPIMEGRGVVKSLWNRLHVLPFHADWFQPMTVHRLERQVVPHFFSGKSAEHTAEKYLDCRNLIVAKYMENSEKRLSIGDCQELVVAVDTQDLSRIFRFLDHWGIINYCAPQPPQESWNIESYLREDPNGEVHVPSPVLKSIDSLIKFDLPKCRFKSCDYSSSLSSTSHDPADLDTRIREMLSESHCNFCSRPLSVVYYQSVKEADTLLCSDCYHEGRLVIGHSSMDFMKADSSKEFGDQDGDSWTDQETLLLLEAVEIYSDNWNEIAEHVGTKSKAQCILHFLRLPVEDGLLEKVDVPSSSGQSNGRIKDNHGISYLKEYGAASGPCDHVSDAEDRFPFGNSENPVMALVAFLASAVGPRVAAACAHASLAALSEDDASLLVNRTNSDDGPAKMRNLSQQKGSLDPDSVNAEASSLPAEKTKNAAKAGLAAAALKAKLFADHEEREIQRLSANIINHQLKRLELKLKQFAEVETLLMKECEQVEKARQRLSGERARAVTSRTGSSGVAPGMNMPAVAPHNNNISNSRAPVISASLTQPSVSGLASSQMSHPQMSYMPRQQMFSFGPRLPLSAIQTSSSGLPSSVMFGVEGSNQSSHSHPMLRPVQGTSSGMG
ncbi:SWI/SNF complex subunit SWI3C [Bienertia sinuspersici]